MESTKEMVKKHLDELFREVCVVNSINSGDTSISNMVELDKCEDKLVKVVDRFVRDNKKGE